MSGVIHLDDASYPSLLKEIHDPPTQLYFKGVWDSALFENCVAVVGSRRMSEYGKQVTNLLIKHLTPYGVTIVSGFMYGVDAEAHTACLEASGRTIAVMPGGIDLVTPACQMSLYKRILSNDGLIVSEYAGSISPKPWSFPRRNRIVAGLSRAVVVIEAALESGSLITAQYAWKFGRKVGVVPAGILSDLSKGCLELLKKGAYLISSSEDILNMIGQSSLKGTDCAQIPLIKTLAPANPLEKNILQLLLEGEKSLDDLCQLLNNTSSIICTTLSYMTLKGLVREGGGKYYAG